MITKNFFNFFEIACAFPFYNGVKLLLSTDLLIWNGASGG